MLQRMALKFKPNSHQNSHQGSWAESIAKRERYYPSLLACEKRGMFAHGDQTI